MLCCAATSPRHPTRRCNRNSHPHRTCSRSLSLSLKPTTHARTHTHTHTQSVSARCVRIIRTARIVCTAGSMNRHGVRPSVPPSVCPIRPLQQRAAGLLLWARRVDRSLHGRLGSSSCGQCHVFSVRKPRYTRTSFNQSINQGFLQWPK